MRYSFNGKIYRDVVLTAEDSSLYERLKEPALSAAERPKGQNGLVAHSGQRPE